MNPSNRIIDISELKPGDLLLCVMSGNTAQQVEQATGSKYTHAGICYDSEQVVHMTLRGIRKHSASQLLNSSQYIAIFRNPYIWSPERLQAFRQFLDDALANRRRYDMHAAETFEFRRDEHRLNLLAKLYDHFENGLSPDNHNKLQYICSDLVVAAFVEIGFIQPSAAIVYKGDAYSAGDLGRDPTFGFFVGYLKPEGTEGIPVDDEFANKVTLGDLTVVANDMMLEQLTGRARLV